MTDVKTIRLTKTLDDYLPPSMRVKAEDAELLVIGGQSFVLSDFPSLRGVFKVGVGTDNIDFEALASANVEFRGPGPETSNAIYDETAAFTCHLVMASLYRATGNFEMWEKSSRPFIRDRKVLLIGRGNIGSRVEALLSPTTNVEIFDLAQSPVTELEAQLDRAEVVSLHIPGDAKNQAFVDAKFLQKMADGATLINTSRGSLIDEDALLHHLVEGRLFAHLDVFSEEPYRGPLRSQIGKNLSVTPHVASTNDAFHQGLAADLELFQAELST